MITAKKGDSIIVKGFTGMKLGVFEVASANKSTVTVMKNNGDELIFDRKSGKQTNITEGKERYANTAMDDDGSYVAPTRPTRKKAAPAKAADMESLPDDDEDEEDEEEDEPVRPAKKTPAKKPSKAKKVRVVEDDDDDDFEEIDD